jgi:hypothetical protein
MAHTFTAGLTKVIDPVAFSVINAVFIYYNKRIIQPQIIEITTMGDAKTSPNWGR